MPYSYQSDFQIGQTIVIKDLGFKAKIVSIWIRPGWTQYEVRWFSNGDSKSAYLFGDELKEVG